MSEIKRYKIYLSLRYTKEKDNGKSMVNYGLSQYFL